MASILNWPSSEALALFIGRSGQGIGDHFLFERQCLLHLRNSVQTEQSHETRSSLAKEERRHYCRGCGRPLTPEFRGHFHKECLRADKRERPSEQRRREQERFKRWLEKQHCLNCGAKYGDQ